MQDIIRDLLLIDMRGKEIVDISFEENEANVELYGVVVFYKEVSNAR